MRENVVAEQLKNYFQQIVLPESWPEKMLKKVETWKKEAEQSTAQTITKIKNRIQETKEKLDRLVDAFLDGTIDKETYLVKKDELILEKTALFEKKCELRKNRLSWFEPLSEFVKAAHRAEKLAKSNDFDEIKSVAEKIGSNHILRDRKLLFDFKKPFDLIPHFIFLAKNKNNNSEKFNSVENRSALRNSCHLKSPINTSVDKISPLLVGEKKSPDFSSKNRRNRQNKSIENGKKSGRRERREIVGNNLISVENFAQNSEMNI